MKEIPWLYLCLLSLLIVISACFTLAHVGSSMAFSRPPGGANTHESIMQGNIIKLNNTDYNSTTAFEQPDLGNTTQNVTARMVVEYGDYAIQQGVYAPTGLPQVFPTRIVIEYADTSFQIGTQRPETLNQTVAPRMIIEYADYATTLTVSPYLGPPPYPYPNSTNPPDTSPPNIVVMREPSGPQVPEGQSVVVSAYVADAESGVRNATLQYTLDNSTDWSSAIAVPMSLNVTLQPQNSLALSFNATIQGQSSGTRVRFRIIAYDFAGNNATKDGITDTTTYLVVPRGPVKSLTSVICSPNPVPAGSPATCTATVSGYNPTGTVTWNTSSSTGYFSNSTSTLSSGTCSTTYTDTSVGSLNITASYSGDPNNLPSNGTITLAVTSAPSKHDVVVSGMSASATVTQGASLPFSVVVLNNGTVAETLVVVNATANGTLIEQQTVPSLGAGSNQTLSFSWNTTGVSVGNYMVTATVTPVANQTDLSGISKSITVQVLPPSGIRYFLNATSPYGSPTPSSGWFDSGTNITESVTSPVSGGSGVQYVCSGWTGTGSVPAYGTDSSIIFTITAPSTVTWNWKTQYYLTVSAPTGVASDQGWYDSSSTAYAMLSVGAIDQGNGTRQLFTNWGADASGTNYAQSDPITMNGAKTASTLWTTQYYLTVSSAYDSPTPASNWYDSGTSISASVTSPVPGLAGTQYVCNGWTGSGSVPSSGSGTSVSFTLSQVSSITWVWKTQCQVTFSESGVGSGFTGTVVTVDGVNYTVKGLPASFWWGHGSGHSFSFASPLAEGSTQYAWNSTFGLSLLQRGTLTVTGSGSVVGNYATAPIPPVPPWFTLQLVPAFTIGLGLIGASVLLVLLEIAENQRAENQRRAKRKEKELAGTLRHFWSLKRT